MKIYTIHTTGVLDRWMRFIGAMLVLALMVPTITVSQTYSNPATVPLLTAGTYGALASTGITGTANVNGDVGAVTGTISGTIIPSGTNWGVGNGNTSTAQSDLGAALTNASGRTNDSTITTNALGGLTLTRGVYEGPALDLASGTTLTLYGSATDVFIIKTAATLIINVNSTVNLAGGAVWTNVFWYVGTSATINSGTTFNGVILANTSITLNASATLVTAKLLANTGAITINSNVLPVEMVSFTATANQFNAELRWSTTTEVNNYGFEIERRQFTNWEKVVFIAGAGTSNSPRDYSYTDNNLSPGCYVYRIKQIDNNGTFSYKNSAEVEIGITEKKFALESNYPNPFNPSTTIQFTVGEHGLTLLHVYNIIGQKVLTLFNGNAQAGQVYQVSFDASRLPSGIYIAKLESGTQQMMKKMLLVK